MKMSLRPHCDSESGKKFICKGLYKKNNAARPRFYKNTGSQSIIFLYRPLG